MSQQTFDIYQVDAFTPHPLGGNPAAVVPLKEWLPDDLLLRIAQENNLSETAYFVPRAAGDGYELRWFTPGTEIALCGHATLATAFVLLKVLCVPERVLSFHTRQRGVLTVEATEDGTLLMNFPIADPKPQSEYPPELLQGLGITAADVEEVLLTDDYLVVLRTAAAVAAVQPDFGVLTQIPVRGVAITAPSDEEGVDFHTRFFGPATGVNEDPVTGSAHTHLVPYWGKRLGKKKFRATQGGQRRGELVCEDIGGGRVSIGGKSSLYLKGQIFI